MNEFELFISAIQSGSIKSINTPINEKYLNKPWGPLQRYPIHLACDLGHIDILKLLINENCDIQPCDKNNWQPIHLACYRGNVEIVKLLLQQKCDIDAVNKTGNSPMKLAEKHRYQEIIDLLTERKLELEEINKRKAQELENMIEIMGIRCSTFCNHKLLCPESMRKKTFPKGTKIGNGAYGNVYRMKGNETQKEFALKYIKIRNIERGYIEGEIDQYIPHLKHPRIIQYFGAIETKKNLCIFMEYFPKETLSQKINNLETGIETKDVIRYTKQILEGLEFLHEKKIIHRDLKPANILLDIEDNIKLTDFGFSRSLKKTNGYSTDAKTFVGTANFTAPEVINNEPYREPADIWSLAATMINMITGNPPLHKFLSVTVIFKIANTKRIDVPDTISDEMKDFITSMLRPIPTERPTATDLLKSNFFK